MAEDAPVPAVKPEIPNGSPLGDRVFRGAAWVAAVRVVQKVLAAVRTVIVARLLGPEQIGVFGIASITLLAVEVLTRTGFEEGLIQKRDLRDAADTGFWVQSVRGLVIAVLSFIAAPVVADFFNEPAAEPVLRVLATLHILRGLRSIGIVLLIRDLRFREESVYQVWAAVVEFVVTLAATFALRSVWGLVIGALAGELTRTMVSYLIHPYRPGFRGSLEQARSLFSFGVWLLLAGIVSYVGLQADNIFVGRTLGAEALGIYQVAFFLAHLPTTELVKQASKVLFPAYAELMVDGRRLAVAVGRAAAAGLAFLIPMTFLLLTVGPDLSVLVLGPRWAGVAPVLSALVVGGFLRSVAAMLNPVLMAAGRTRAVFAGELSRAVLLILLLVLLLGNAGLVGVAWAATASLAATLAVSVAATRTIVGLRAVISEIFPSAVAALPLAAAFGLSRLLYGAAGGWGMCLLAGAGIITYGYLFWHLDRRAEQPLVTLVRDRIMDAFGAPPPTHTEG